MAAEPTPDECYASSEDSDFAPDEAPADDEAGSGSEAESQTEPQTEASRPSAKRKRVEAGGKSEDGDAGFDNSGDEAIIEKGKKRAKKAKRKDGLEKDEDEGGEGGLIKTRRQRAAEKEERKFAAISGPVTVDVDSLWASMTAAPVASAKPQPQTQAQKQAGGEGGADGKAGVVEATAADGEGNVDEAKAAELPDTVTIRHVYRFAGQEHVEEKTVARDSAEAKLYFATHPDADPNAPTVSNESDKPPKRMPKKAFRSIFEPITDNAPARTDLNLGMSVRLQAARDGDKTAAKKLNVVQKSKMDWAGFVDKEGIKDELELAGKSKESFAGRQQFLARVEAKRDEDARQARMAGRA